MYCLECRLTGLQAGDNAPLLRPPVWWWGWLVFGLCDPPPPTASTPPPTPADLKMTAGAPPLLLLWKVLRSETEFHHYLYLLWNWVNQACSFNIIAKLKDFALNSSQFFSQNSRFLGKNNENHSIVFCFPLQKKPYNFNLFFRFALFCDDENISPWKLSRSA